MGQGTDLRCQTTCWAVGSRQFVLLSSLLGSPSSPSSSILHWAAPKHMHKQCYMDKHASGNSNKLNATVLWIGHISGWSIMSLWNHIKPSLQVSWTRTAARFGSSPLLLFSKCFSQPRSSFHLTFFLVLNSDKEQIHKPECYWYTSLGAVFTCLWIWGSTEQNWLQWVNCNYFAWLQ